MLERLSPMERAAFVLRTVFDYEYSEIADVLDKSELYVRKIVSRAKGHLSVDTPRFRPTREKANALAEQFLAACRAGDAKLVEQFLTEDVEVYSDGGGKVTAARVVIQGRDRAARFLCGVFRKLSRYCELRPTQVNGGPGVVFLCDGQVKDVISFKVGEKIETVCITVNPDKLVRWAAIEVE